MTINEPTISRNQFGNAMFVLHHLVWPARWHNGTDNWSLPAGDDNVPFFGFAAENIAPSYRTQPLVELRVMLRDLDGLYAQGKPVYTAKDIARYAKELTGIEALLAKKVGECDIGCALEREKPMSLLEATKTSYRPLKHRDDNFEALDALFSVAHTAIDQKMDTPSYSFVAKYGDQQKKNAEHQR